MHIFILTFCVLCILHIHHILPTNAHFLVIYDEYAHAFIKGSDTFQPCMSPSGSTFVVLMHHICLQLEYVGLTAL